MSLPYFSVGFRLIKYIHQYILRLPESRIKTTITDIRIFFSGLEESKLLIIFPTSQ